MTFDATAKLDLKEVKQAVKDYVEKITSRAVSDVTLGVTLSTCTVHFADKGLLPPKEERNGGKD